MFHKLFTGQGCRAPSGKLPSNFLHPSLGFAIFLFTVDSSSSPLAIYTSSSAFSLLSSFPVRCSCACFASGSLTQFRHAGELLRGLLFLSIYIASLLLNCQIWLLFFILCKSFNLDLRGLVVGFFANLNLVCLFFLLLHQILKLGCLEEGDENFSPIVSDVLDTD